MALITGTLHQNRNTELLQLLLYLRIVMDHRGLNGKVTAFAEDPLVIRRAVFSRIDHIPGFHGRHCLRNIPAGLFCSGQPYGSDPVDRPKKIHGRGSHQINTIQRLHQHCNIPVKPLRRLFPFRDHEVLTFQTDRDQRISIFIIINGKFLCIQKLHTVVKSQTRYGCRPLFCFCCLRRKTAGSQKRYCHNK